MNDHYKARPTELPRPTYWPFFLAFGVSLIFWGVLTTWLISGMGLLVFAIAIGGWLGDVAGELASEDEVTAPASPADPVATAE